MRAIVSKIQSEALRFIGSKVDQRDYRNIYCFLQELLIGRLVNNENNFNFERKVLLLSYLFQ